MKITDKPSRRSLHDFEKEALDHDTRQHRIARQPADQLENAGVVIQYEDPDASVAYAVAEIPMTVQEQDRVRASERAHAWSGHWITHAGM